MEGEGRCVGRLWKPYRDDSLTLVLCHRYNHRAWRPGDGRRGTEECSEEDIPTKQPEACEDSWFPQAHVDQSRPRDHRSAAPQGPQSSVPERGVGSIGLRAEADNRAYYHRCH